MKANKLVVQGWILLVLAFCVAPVAAVSQTLSLQEEKDTRIWARATDYQARLDALYRERLAAWSASFLQQRQGAIRRAGEVLATEAVTVRAARRGSWDEVGKDPQFVAAEKQQIALLLEPQQIRRELTAWAREVETQTRNEMIEFFRQLIAEDLGKVFDQDLRGQVVRAVQAIPLETLVTGDTARIEARIRFGLPTSALTHQQRTSISAAATALAFAAGPAIATAAGMPALSKEIGSLAAFLVQILAAHGLDMLDQSLSGEPSAEALSRQITLSLQDWQTRNLEERLRQILDRFGKQVMDALEGQARRINLQRPLL